jgi:adenine-specific DNA glycosylase
MKTYTNKKTGTDKAFVFLESQCSNCPMRDHCTLKGKGRIVSLHPEEQKRREIIEQTQTPEFKALYRNRAKVERKVAHVMRKGMRKSRYIGKSKTLTQLAFRAAGVNIKRIFKCAKGEFSVFERLTKILAS